MDSFGLCGSLRAGSFGLEASHEGSGRSLEGEFFGEWDSWLRIFFIMVFAE
jgi:hypothetical protein